MQPVLRALSMTVTISGTRANPHGDGHIELHNGIAYGVGVPLLKSDLRFRGWRASVQQHRIQCLRRSSFRKRRHQHCRTSSLPTRLNLVEERGSPESFRTQPRSRPFPTHSRPDRFTADGSADFTLRVSGTPEQPSLEAHVHLKDLAFDKERAGDFYLDAVTRAATRSQGALGFR
jgi:autotransporter translocation and assembly factor TamB